MMVKRVMLVYRRVYFTVIYSDILLCAGFRGTHRDSMMPQPSTAPEPEGWDPEEEDHSPCPQDLGDEEYSAGPDAASMEGAISKFMEGLQVQERSGFPQIHRLLSRLPVPVQKKTRCMTHTEAIEGRYLPNMSEEEQKRFTPSKLILYR